MRRNYSSSEDISYEHLIIKPQKNNRQFRLLVLVVLGLSQLVAGFAVLHYRATSNPKATTVQPSPTPFVQLSTNTSSPAASFPEITPSPTPTPTPTLTPTPIPTVTPTAKATATPKPTPTPIPVAAGSSYAYKQVATEVGTFGANVMMIDLAHADMKTVSATSTDCKANCPTQSLGQFIKTNTAFAGVNGTYFCPPDYSECASKINSYDFTFYDSPTQTWINRSNAHWKDRAMLLVDETGAHFHKKPGSNEVALYIWGSVNGKKKTIAALVNAPGLVDNGQVIVDSYPLTDKQKAKSFKMGIGFSDATHIIVVGANAVTMKEFAYVLKAVGARYALNLDAGGSTALWYGGYYKYGPGRSLPNAIVFTAK